MISEALRCKGYPLCRARGLQAVVAGGSRAGKRPWCDRSTAALREALQLAPEHLAARAQGRGAASPWAPMRQEGVIYAQRAQVLEAAYRAHLKRFKGKMPTPPARPEMVGINLPNAISETENTHDLSEDIDPGNAH